MLHSLGLNSATEHEVRHARLSAVHDPEPHHAVTAEPIFAGKHIRVQIRCGLYFSKYVAVISVAGKVQLVCALGKFVYALQILIGQRSDFYLNLTMTQE